MAFEKISEYAEKLYEEIRELERAIDREHNREIKQGMGIRSKALWAALVLYYQTVLQHSKFKSQRDHCRYLMEKLNPSWCQGYFKTKKK